MSIRRFFALAVERQNIYLRRCAGEPAPWTSDKIMASNKFCNVFREQDRTTCWFREHVRGPMREEPDVLLATVLFRWFNRISTGEAIFMQPDLTSGLSSWERRGDLGTPEMVRLWCREMRATIRAYCGSGPYVTGAYMIRSPTGMDKLSGMLSLVEQFASAACPRDRCGMTDWLCSARWMLRNRERATLRGTWEWLKEKPGMGPFLAYEVVSDLRHTALLDRASDIMTWANPGPGAERGLARVLGRFEQKMSRKKGRLTSKLSPECRIPQRMMLNEMQQILAMSRLSDYWPQPRGEALDFRSDKIYLHSRTSPAAQWPAWEMRDVEHWLCEFDKHERIRLGQGTLKARFHPHTEETAA